MLLTERQRGWERKHAVDSDLPELCNNVMMNMAFFHPEAHPTQASLRLDTLYQVDCMVPYIRMVRT